MSDINYADFINANTAQRGDTLVGVVVPTSSAVFVKMGELNPFTGSIPCWDPEGAIGDGPTDIIGGIPGLLDCRNAHAVITEMHYFEQFKGGAASAQRLREQGLDPEVQKMLELTVSIIGAKIGYESDGEFVAHPMYAPWDPETGQADLSFITSRALEAYLKTVFNPNDDVVMQLQQIALTNGFVPIDLPQSNPDRQSLRAGEIFHIAAHAGNGNARARILERQKNGLAIDGFSIRPPRDEVFINDQGVEVLDYTDFFRSTEENLHRAVSILAEGPPLNEDGTPELNYQGRPVNAATKAGRLSSAITGVNGQFPLRATVSTVDIKTPTAFDRLGKPVAFDTEELNFWNVVAEEDVVA